LVFKINLLALIVPKSEVRRSYIIFITFLLILSLFKFSSAQDTIIRKTGVKIICEIVKVDSTNIQYNIRLKDGTRVKTFLPIEDVTEYKYGPKLGKANYWFNVGVGAGIVRGGFRIENTDNEAGPSYGFNFSTQMKRGLISIRYIYNEEMIFLNLLPKESVRDIGVLYGRIAKASYGFASISGGISCVSGVHRGKFQNFSDHSINYEKQPYSTFGIPLESQLFWTPSSFIGLGIYGFANINPEKSFYGGLFCIQLGRLK
jgi:hypothetical protein